MIKDRKTSKEVASQSGKLLRDPKTPKKYKGIIASNLSQAAGRRKSTKK